MTFKGIWSSFCDKTKEQGIKAWEGIKQVCSSSFSILKNTVIGFFTGIYNWLVDIITGVGKVVIALVSFVFSAIVHKPHQVKNVLYSLLLSYSFSLSSLDCSSTNQAC